MPLALEFFRKGVRIGTDFASSWHLLAVQRVVGQVDDPSNGETDDVMTSFTYTAAPSTSGDPPAGLLQTVTDPLNRATAWSYDQLGRTVAVTDALNQTTAFAYDAGGNLLSVTDPLDHTTSYTYDNLYRRTAITDPLSGVTSFTFDLAGNLTSLTDPVGNTTTWDYDALNRVVAETNELNNSRTFTYDAANNLLTRTDRNGRVIEYAYDTLHRRVEEQWLDDQQTVIRTLSFSYDAASQLTAAADPAASYDYQLVATSDYTFDAAGRLTALSHAQGVTPLAGYTWTYDAANRVTEFTSSAPRKHGRRFADNRSMQCQKHPVIFLSFHFFVVSEPEQGCFVYNDAAT